jgi:hypothetical protein
MRRKCKNKFFFFFYVESISNHTSIYRVLKIMNFGIKKYMLSNNCPKKIMKNKNLHIQLKYDRYIYAFK